MKHCDKLIDQPVDQTIDQPVDQTIDQPVVLPEGKLADDGDCCGDCDHGIDYKDGGFFGTNKVLCGLDGKWHKAKDVCRHYE